VKRGILIAVIAGSTVMAEPVRAQTPSSDLLGCYELRFGEFNDWHPAAADTVYYRPPPIIRLIGGEPDSGGGHIIDVPPGSIPSPHPRAVWAQSGDSVRLGWSTGFIGVSALVTRSERGLSGVLSPFTDVLRPEWPETPIEAIRRPCDAPTTYPIDSMRRFLRAVELVTGDSVRIGHSLPPGIRTREETRRRTYVEADLAAPFGDAQAISIRFVRDNLVGGVTLEYPDLSDPRDLLELLVSAYGPWQGLDEYDDRRSWVWQGRAEMMSVLHDPDTGTRLSFADPRLGG